MKSRNKLTMNLLKKTAERIYPQQYSDVVVLHINHCMDNSFYFNDILNGIFYKTIFVGTPYNNKEIQSNSVDYAFYTAKTYGNQYTIYRNNELVTEQLLSENTSASVGIRTRLLIEQAIIKDVVPELEAGKRFLIIEDGGENFRVMSRLIKEYPILKERIIGAVEQTTSGTRKFYSNGNRNGYEYPCASVSRSRIKMGLEAVFIGQRIVEELSRFMYTANSFLNFQDVLILGYGIVGRSVSTSLSPMACRLRVYDSDPVLMETAIADGHKAVRDIKSESLEHDTVVIGCAGTNSFDRELLVNFMKGDATNLYLASASSKNVEFIDFIEEAEGSNKQTSLQLKLVKKSKYYKQYLLSDGSGRSKNVFLFADGMPVNFYDENTISLTYRLIDVIFTEMLLLGQMLCDIDGEKRVENDSLMLLGYDEIANTYVDESKLIEAWFDINDLEYNNDYSSDLRVHPNEAYLRQKLLESK